jgi:hypothetical protein
MLPFNIANSVNIDINGLKSAVEGSANEIKGAIESLNTGLGTNVSQVASSLLSSQFSGIDTGFQGILSSAPTSAFGRPPFANPLEKYASVNYVFTLSCLSVDDLNRPDSSYRLHGPTNIICRSGGSGQVKVQTATERGKGPIEFYIDDVEIESVITHGKGTKQADAIGGSFKIFEPYSMGMFYETLQVAALKSGHKNYIQSPFLLTLQFKGYDDNGNVSLASGSTRLMPIKIINSVFNVTEQGSTYEVEFVKYNDQAFGDQVQAAKTDLNLSGKTVQEILQSGGNSLSSVLNTRLLKSKEAKQVNKVDQYIVMFPTKRSSADEAILGKPNDAATGATTSGKTSEGQVKELSQERKQEIFESIAGIQAGNVPENFDENLSKALGIVIQRGEVGEAIRTYAENPENVNAIGKAAITKSANDSGEVPQTSPNLCEVENGLVCRAKVQIPATTRSFQFKAGEKIQNIIEQTILASDWGRKISERLNAPDANNMVDWFKIESQVYEQADAKTVNATGQNPKVYVYRIVPFKVNASRFASPSKPTPGIASLKLQAAKEYNYIYTGKNKDIIDFDIQFDAAFFVGIGAQKGQASKDSKTATQSSKVAGDAESPNKLNPGDQNTFSSSGMTQSKEIDKKPASQVGGGQEWSETQVARQFNDALLDSRADLIEVELKIWGDPFWINDSGAGNYTARPTSFINITEDGSVDTQSSEVDLMLNFRTPFDIDDSGWMDFGGVSAPTKAFSGLYQCVGVVSSFSSGKFEQTLSLIRRRNQETDIKAVASKSGNALIGAGGADNIIDKVRGIFT